MHMYCIDQTLNFIRKNAPLTGPLGGVNSTSSPTSNGLEDRMMSPCTDKHVPVLRCMSGSPVYSCWSLWQ